MVTSLSLESFGGYSEPGPGPRPGRRRGRAFPEREFHVREQVTHRVLGTRPDRVHDRVPVTHANRLLGFGLYTERTGGSMNSTNCTASPSGASHGTAPAAVPG